jgi:hypothetical protein
VISVSMLLDLSNGSHINIARKDRTPKHTTTPLSHLLSLRSLLLFSASLR